MVLITKPHRRAEISPDLMRQQIQLNLEILLPRDQRIYTQIDF
uniref:Uncharacterized protein n=1 Tax=Physcomitrium patens TaxID=3218 RepID=A0A2K1J0X6_PHYPA|nr:hypothetical protein PHYPA_023076 [Physcomitrium patens]